MLRSLAVLLVLSSLSLPGRGAATGTDLGEAFKVVYGHAQPYTLPDMEKRCHCQHLTARGLLLQPLADGRYALVSITVDELANHAPGGPVSVTYLTRSGGRFHLIRQWQDFVEFKNHAATAEFHAVRGGKVLTFVRDEYMGQGEGTEEAEVIEMTRSAPVLRASHLPLGADSTGTLCQRCTTVKYSATVVPATEAGADFAVRYRGWESEALGTPHHAIDKVFQYRMNHGTYAPTRPFDLPS
jgi:hypothetical protein